jgi:hypothetical protein
MCLSEAVDDRRISSFTFQDWYNLGGDIMSKCLMAGVLGLIVLFASPVEAKQQAAKGKGVICTQGTDSFALPASTFSAKVRANMRKGQKVNINVPGYGPLSCVVY